MGSLAQRATLVRKFSDQRDVNIDSPGPQLATCNAMDKRVRPASQMRSRVSVDDA